jgi:hypothetical protein
MNQKSASKFEFAASFPREAEQTRKSVVNTITRAFSLFDRKEINAEVEIESTPNADDGGYYYQIVASKNLQTKIELKKKVIDELPELDRIKSFLDLRSDKEGDIYEMDEYYDSERKSVIGMYSQRQSRYVDSLDSDKDKALLDRYCRIAAAHRYCKTSDNK